MAIDKLFPKKSSFRPINRFERSDPSLKRLYQKQKSQWESEAEKAGKEWDEYVKEMERLYGKDWARVLQQKKLEGQRATRKAEVEKAAEDMRSGKTSSFKGAAAGGIPTFKPATLDTKKAEGPVQVRRAIPQQRVFKAMVSGKPEASQVFSSQAQADKYLQEEYNKRVSGLQTDWRKATDRGDTATAKKLENQIKSQRMGVVASVRGTPEEMTRYKEESLSGMREEARLKDLYLKRELDAKARAERLQTAMQDYNEAESPELKATAGQRIEEAKREIDVAQKTRGMSEDQKRKFTEGLGGVPERRNAREAETARKTEKARAESRAFWGDIAITEAAKKAIRDWEVQTSRLKSAYSKALSRGDDIEAMRLYQILQEYLRFLPEDENERLEFARSGAIDAKKQQMAEEEERRRQSIMRSNPDASGY